MVIRGSAQVRGGFVAAVATVVGLASWPAFGAGFSIFEQGSKAMGMAGAFTAQADDGSALFHNVGGLAFQKEGSLTFGTTFIKPDAEFRGLAPFPGPTARAEQDPDLLFFPSHFYWVKPVNERLTFGFGFNTPFGLTTEWDEKDTFPGRYLSTLAELQTFDLTPSVGWKVNENFGVGISAVARVSTVHLERRVPFLNPFTGRVQDAGEVSLESDVDTGYGFNVGLLHKLSDSVQWGLTYRSKVKIDYSGDGRFKQITTGSAGLDALLRTRIPFDQDLPIETEVEFPDSASLGVAYRVTPTFLVETDINWTGWSSFDEVNIRFTRNPQFNSVLPEEYKDVYHYRIGAQWDRGTCQWRAGYVFDETPQPEEAVSPLLPDSSRNGFTVGYGHKGARYTFDAAFMYLPFEKRTRDQSFAGEGAYFGTYESTAYLLGLTLSRR